MSLQKDNVKDQEKDKEKAQEKEQEKKENENKNDKKKELDAGKILVMFDPKPLRIQSGMNKLLLLLQKRFLVNGKENEGFDVYFEIREKMIYLRWDKDQVEEMQTLLLTVKEDPSYCLLKSQDTTYALKFETDPEIIKKTLKEDYFDLDKTEQEFAKHKNSDSDYNYESRFNSKFDRFNPYQSSRYSNYNPNYKHRNYHDKSKTKSNENKFHTYEINKYDKNERHEHRSKNYNDQNRRNNDNDDRDYKYGKYDSRTRYSRQHLNSHHTLNQTYQNLGVNEKNDKNEKQDYQFPLYSYAPPPHHPHSYPYPYPNPYYYLNQPSLNPTNPQVTNSNQWYNHYYQMQLHQQQQIQQQQQQQYFRSQIAHQSSFPGTNPTTVSNQKQEYPHSNSYSQSLLKSFDPEKSKDKKTQDDDTKNRRSRSRSRSRSPGYTKNKSKIKHDDARNQTQDEPKNSEYDPTDPT